MGELSAFGLAGRAGRVHDGAHVVWLDVLETRRDIGDAFRLLRRPLRDLYVHAHDALKLCAGAELGRELISGCDGEHGAAVAGNLLRELGRAAGVDGHGPGAYRLDREVAVEPLDAVLRDEDDRIAGLHAGID